MPRQGRRRHQSDRFHTLEKRVKVLEEKLELLMDMVMTQTLMEAQQVFLKDVKGKNLT